MRIRWAVPIGFAAAVWASGVFAGRPAAPGNPPELGVRDAEPAAAIRVPSAEYGEALFFRETFGGNGRTCAACHDPRNEFTTSPSLVEARFAADPSHPLFRAIDSDDGGGRTFTTVRSHALFRVTIPLHPNVRLVDDPARRTITVWRSVPALANLVLTAPYLQDGRAATLDEQIVGAIADHFEPGREPRPPELVSLRLFLSGQFYPQRLRSLLDSTDPVPKEPGFSIPAESPAAVRGKLVFDRHCRSCHGGETGDRPASGQTPRFATVFVSERNLVELPLVDLEIRRPDGSVLRTATPDPGRAAITGDILDLNAFEVTALRGVKHTAPYFHDNSAATLGEVVDHYNATFPFRITREQKADLISYLELF